MTDKQFNERIDRGIEVINKTSLSKCDGLVQITIIKALMAMKDKPVIVTDCVQYTAPGCVPFKTKPKENKEF